MKNSRLTFQSDLKNQMRSAGQLGGPSRQNWQYRKLVGSSSQNMTPPRVDVGIGDKEKALA